MSVHEWIACTCGGVMGAPGFALVFSGFPWGGVALILMGLFIRYYIMGHDLDS